MSTALTALTSTLATKLGMGENGSELVSTLKATAFKGQVSDSQMVALLIVANQYGLNPWTKEIYAFPDKNNGIVPVVGVDGWSRIINTHPQFDGLDFAQDDESCTCVMYRKDRTHPIKVTEFASECKRDVAPWRSHPKRMLRHKAMIQCARLAFGYVGIYDEDEAERIAEIDVTPRRQTGTQAAETAAAARAKNIDTEERAKLIADLELVCKEQGREGFRATWTAMSTEAKSMVGIQERDRIDALGNSVIEGEAAQVSDGEDHE